MGDKSPKAKARAKKQELRLKNDHKKAAHEPRTTRPTDTAETPKTH